MNKERIEQLARAIETGGIAELGFNMEFFHATKEVDASRHNCGTVACIAGWACALGKIDGEFLAAIEWLDIPYRGVGNELFFPGRESGISVYDWKAITPAHAAAVLWRLAATGTVDWTAVLPEEMWERPVDDEAR